MLRRKDWTVQELQRGKPLPALPGSANLDIIPTRPGTPYPHSSITQQIPIVESNATIPSSSRSTLVQNPDIERTQEWHDYRRSLATDSDIPELELNRASISLQSSSTGVDSSNRETSPEWSSTGARFYKRQQLPVDTIDILQVIADNLQQLINMELVGEYQQTYQEIYDHLAQALYQIKEQLPVHLNDRPRKRFRNFALYLDEQADRLKERITDSRSLINPELHVVIEKLKSNRIARKTHQRFLYQAQRLFDESHITQL